MASKIVKIDKANRNRLALLFNLLKTINKIEIKINTLNQ